MQSQFVMFRCNVKYLSWSEMCYGGSDEGCDESGRRAQSSLMGLVQGHIEVDKALCP